MSNKPTHQQASSVRIRANYGKQLTDRFDPAKKLGGPAKVVPVFNPPIITSTPVAPDLKLRQRVRHGS